MTTMDNVTTMNHVVNEHDKVSNAKGQENIQHHEPLKLMKTPKTR